MNPELKLPVLRRAAAVAAVVAGVLLTVPAAQAAGLNSRYLTFRNPIQMQACLANANDALRRSGVNIVRQTEDAVLGADAIGVYSVICVAEKGVVFVALAENRDTPQSDVMVQKIADTMASYRW